MRLDDVLSDMVKVLAQVNDSENRVWPGKNVDVYGHLVNHDTIRSLEAVVEFSEELRARGIFTLEDLGRWKWRDFMAEPIERKPTFSWKDPIQKRVAFSESMIQLARNGDYYVDGDLFCIECGEEYMQIIMDFGVFSFAFCKDHYTPEDFDVTQDWLNWPNAYRLHQARVYYKLKEQGLADA